MGKIRIKTFGDEELEQKQADKARKKSEAKRIAEELVEAAKKLSGEDPASKVRGTEKVVDPEAEGTESLRTDRARATKSENTGVDAQKDDKVKEKSVAAEQTKAAPNADSEATDEKQPKKKKEKFLKAKQKIRSKGYTDALTKIDKNKLYTLKDALVLLESLKRTNFDETVELHINTAEQGVGGTVTLPHGTGKIVRVQIADSTNDPDGFAALLKEIEAGKINFDVLLATPETMPSLAKVARVLGPRGLMPNPKSGTVTKDPQKKADDFAKGQMTFKTEAKAPIIHLTVGKVSFGKEKLTENIKTIVSALPNEKIASITLKSTMSPGIRVTLTN